MVAQLRAASWAITVVVVYTLLCPCFRGFLRDFFWTVIKWSNGRGRLTLCFLFFLCSVWYLDPSALVGAVFIVENVGEINMNLLGYYTCRKWSGRYLDGGIFLSLPDNEIPP